MSKHIPSRNNGVDPVYTQQDIDAFFGRPDTYHSNLVKQYIISPRDGTVEPAEHYVHDYGHDYDDIPF